MAIQAFLICVIAVLPAVSGEIDCSNGGVFPHPTKCQGYYDCSLTEKHILLEKYETECTYPDLFDYNKKKCVPYNEADCGPAERVEEKDPCKYVKNQCPVAHCIPCNIMEPSCVGLSDGYHAHPDKIGSSEYMVCEDGRRIERRVCETDSRTDTTKIFYEKASACLSPFEVPRDAGGLAPSCDGKAPNKMYQTDEKDNVLYSCPDEQVYFCGRDLFFNEDTQKCEGRPLK